MTVVRNPTALVCTFLWIGFVCAISFMEAWLKFKAPGITVPLGLGIGRLVFDTLNKVEWGFALAVIVSWVLAREKWFSFKTAVFIIPLLLLIIQTFWLLPELDTRAELIIRVQDLPPSNLHFYYVGMEFIKVITLTIFGTSQFKMLKS